MIHRENISGGRAKCPRYIQQRDRHFTWEFIVMIQTISDKLLSLLETLKWDDQPFVEVLDYHTIENVTGYPYLTFEPIGFSAEILDTCNNIRTYQFQILIFQEITATGGRQEAKEIITKSIDDVVQLLDENYTLNWDVIVVQPIGGTIRPFVINSWKALVWELTINIKVSVFIK